MSHLERLINKITEEKTLLLHIATITVEGQKMTIQKSKVPHLYAMSSMYLTAVLLTCVLMATSPMLHIHPPLWEHWKVWVFYLGGFFIMTIATNLPGLTLLIHAETIVVDCSLGTVSWDGQYACRISEVESIRIWTRLYNGYTIYRVSLILHGNRAFHLVETPPGDLAEQFQSSLSLRSFFRFWPITEFTDWTPYSVIPTGDDNGKYGQFAFAWILARFLNVPIR